MYAIILANIGAALYGLALGVIAYRSYNMQAKILALSNRYDAFSIARYQAILGSTLMASVSILIPAIPYGATWLWLAVICYPLVAAIASGGYEHLRHTWLSMKYTTMHNIFHSIDRTLNYIPKNILKFVLKIFNYSHRNLGQIYIALQTILFLALFPTANLLLGIMGLTYIGLAVLRAHRYLPDRITYALEKLDYWVNQFAEVILRSTVFNITAVLQITYGVIFNIIVPKIIKKLTGEDREFWHVSDLNKTKELPDRITSDISLEDFKTIMQTLPRIEPLDNAKKNNSRIELLTEEFDAVTEHIKLEVINTYATMQEQDINADDANVNLADKAAFSVIYDLVYPEARQLYLLLAKINVDMKKAAELHHVNRGYTMSALHMTHVPHILPPLEFNFVEFKQTLQAHYKQLSEHSNQQLLDSINFSAFDLPLAARWRDIKAQRESLQQQRRKVPNRIAAANVEALLAQNAAEIAKFTEIQIERWRSELNLAADTQQKEVFAEYIRVQLNKVCNEIEHCNSILTNYKVESLPEFQTKGRHVLALALDLIKLDDAEGIKLAYKILATLAIEAVSPVGVHDAVDTLYYKYVFPKLCKEHSTLSAYDKLTIYLQKIRFELYEDLYEAMSANVVFATLLYNVDFKGRNAQMAVMKTLAPLNLQGKFNTQSELANDPGLFEEILINFFAYTLARAMMTFKYGYSPEYILEQMLALEDYSLCLDWAEEFNPEVRDYIYDIMQNSDDEQERRALLTVWLYSARIFCCTQPDPQQTVETILPNAKDPVIAPTSPILTYAWQGVQFAYDSIYKVADYITREPTLEEKEQMQRMNTARVEF